MTFRSKLKAARRSYEDGGVTNLCSDMHQFSRSRIARPLSRLYPGANIFEESWEVLIVLDACRFDLMNEVEAGYDFISCVDSRQSVGSKTTEWLQKTFSSKYTDEMEEMIYVTGNPNSHRYLDPTRFLKLDEVWRYQWDEELGTIPPEPITDRAIDLARTREYSRLLIHYMQPHAPFIPDPELGGKDSWKRIAGVDSDIKFESVWDGLKRGSVDERVVWTAYRNNLCLVLDSVELLLNNVNADRVIVTSDHGNAMGEFGYYGHPAYVPIPSLRRVPWIETTASDSGTHDPEPFTRKPVDQGVETQLRDLGYKG